MASTRLRHTFRYPADSDSDSDSARDLDEEHQEALITTLRAADAQKTTLHRRLYLLIPLLAALICARKLLSPSSLPRQRVLAVGALTTVVLDAWAVWFLPIPPARREDGGRWFWEPDPGLSPVEQYLPVLNGVLAGLVSVAGWAGRRRGSGEELWSTLLPAAVFGVSFAVRELLRPVDLEGLERRRYGLKGA